MDHRQALMPTPEAKFENTAQPPVVSEYLQHRARPLFAACREMGRDGGGAACPTCSIKTICDAGRMRSAGKRCLDVLI
jgi:hypothetical protein